MPDGTPAAEAPSAPVESTIEPGAEAPPEDNSNGGPDATGLLGSGDVAPPAQDSSTDVGAPDNVDITRDIPLAEKPSYIPQQFWDPKTGTPKDQAFYKSYTDIRKEMNRLRQEKGNYEAPETADLYLKDYVVVRILYGVLPFGLPP